MGDDLSYGLNTLGPLCLWQCLQITANISIGTHLQLSFGQSEKDPYSLLQIIIKVEKKIRHLLQQCGDDSAVNQTISRLGHGGHPN